MKKSLNLASSVPTLEDVARLAGVGRGTAGRALSGQGYVSEEASARIHAAAERLGYKRNEIARNLKMRRSGAVGLVVPDIGGPFMINCVRGIQKVLRENNLTPILAFTDGKEEVECEEIEYLVRHQVDGIIIVPATGAGKHLQVLQQRQIPIVAFDRPLSNLECDAVLVNNQQGTRNAIEHLIAHGHKRIGCLGESGHLYTIRKRAEGYRDAMKCAGLASLLAIVDPADGGIENQLDRWLALSEPPTAIFSLNELTTVELMQSFSIRKIRMPSFIAFAGFDDIQLGPYLDPPLTVIQQPANEIGERVAERLLNHLQSRTPIVPKRILLKTNLVLRGSCGCPWQAERR